MLWDAHVTLAYKIDTGIQQRYFTGPGQSDYYLVLIETTLNNMGKSFTWVNRDLWSIQTNTKHNKPYPYNVGYIVVTPFPHMVQA